MIDLRETLQELAEAAASHGDTPGPAAAIRRGRQRRRRIAGAAAAILAVALAVATGTTGQLAGRLDLPATSPVTSLPPLPALDLDNQAHRSGVDRAESTLDKAVDRCPGGSTAHGTLIGFFRSAEYRRLVVLGGKPPSIAEPTICWTVGVFDPDGSGKPFGPVKPVPIATPLTANVQGSGGHGTIYGQADMRTHRVRVRFRDQPTILDVPAIYGLYRWDVNFYVGLFPPGWVPVEVTSFDAAGHQLAGCAVGLPVGGLPRCPGN